MKEQVQSEHISLSKQPRASKSALVFTPQGTQNLGSASEDTISLDGKALVCSTLSVLLEWRSLYPVKWRLITISVVMECTCEFIMIGWPLWVVLALNWLRAIYRHLKVTGTVKASVLSILLERLISIGLKQENWMRSQNNLKRSVRVKSGCIVMMQSAVKELWNFLSMFKHETWTIWRCSTVLYWPVWSLHLASDSWPRSGWR